MNSLFIKLEEGILLVYSINNLQSFQHIRKWFDESKKYTPENIPTILVGNKCDLENERVVKSELIQNILQTLTLEDILKDQSN